MAKSIRILVIVPKCETLYYLVPRYCVGYFDSLLKENFLPWKSKLRKDPLSYQPLKGFKTIVLCDFLFNSVRSLTCHLVAVELTNLLLLFNLIRFLCLVFETLLPTSNPLSRRLRARVRPVRAQQQASAAIKLVLWFEMCLNKIGKMLLFPSQLFLLTKGK